MKKESKCKYCGTTFETKDKSAGWVANHVRWCHLNPKRKEYASNLSQRARQKAISPEAREKANEKIKKLWKEGRYSNVKHNHFLGKKHSQETKDIMSKKARASKHRRLRRKMIEYNGVLLDSTWEYELAKRLDEKNIKWIRPDPIKWIDDNGLDHNYFPDFYLVDYDLYIDPKNKHAYKVQKDKIKILLTQIKNLVILTSLDECKGFDIKEHK